MGSFLSALWSLWTTDGLRSVGILIPPTSLLLCLRARRGIEWKRCSGTWWGLALVAIAVIGARLEAYFMVAPAIKVNFLPGGLLLWAYGSDEFLTLSRFSFRCETRCSCELSARFLHQLISDLRD